MTIQTMMPNQSLAWQFYASRLAKGFRSKSPEQVKGKGAKKWIVLWEMEPILDEVDVMQDCAIQEEFERKWFRRVPEEVSSL